MSQSVLQTILTEGATAVYSCTFTDRDGTPIVSGAVTALTATLRDIASGIILNSREDQDVLNTNGGTLGLAGAFSLTLTPDDLAMLSDGWAVQQRRLVLTVTYDVGTLVHEVIFSVRDVDRIP